MAAAGNGGQSVAHLIAAVQPGNYIALDVFHLKVLGDGQARPALVTLGVNGAVNVVGWCGKRGVQLHQAHLPENGCPL